MTKSKKKTKKRTSSKKKIASRKKEPIKHKKKIKTTISSPKSLHVFDNSSILELEGALLLNKAYSDYNEIQFAVKLHDLLSKNTPNETIASNILTEYSAKAYRVTELGRDPLDNQYTLGAGGRVNIGLTQIIKDIPNLRATSGIYCSLEKETAIAEYESAAPIGPTTCIYEIFSQQEKVKLIDLDTAVEAIDRLLPTMSLITKVAAIPYYSEWKFQKHPLASQLIGDWLARHILAADGIAFKSTKKPNGTNLFIFTTKSWNFKKITI